MAANPFYPVMTHFTMPLHATSEELIALASRWSVEQGLDVSLERYTPRYAPAALAPGADLRAAIADFEPVRRICLRRGEFDVNAVTEIEHLQRNPHSFVMVLEPVTEDGLRATALAGRMGDEEILRDWVELARGFADVLHRGAWVVDAQHRARTYVDDHLHTEGAHALACDGVRMLAATGSAIFEFADLD